MSVKRECIYACAEAESNQATIASFIAAIVALPQQATNRNSSHCQTMVGRSVNVLSQYGECLML